MSNVTLLDVFHLPISLAAITVEDACSQPTSCLLHLFLGIRTEFWGLEQSFGD
ncbi:MAG: hypothetical protein WBP64_12495 [Nitrososphaeraceae archaeon]